MTVPFPLDAFDDALSLHRKPPRRFNREKLISIGITVAVHAVIAAGALTAVHVQTLKVPKVLTVQIAEEQKVEPLPDLVPKPVLAQPTIVTVPMPEITIQSVTPPPITAQVSQPRAAPVAMPAPASKGVAEGRDSYFGRLLAQLNRYKRYPQAARAARVTGVVMLHFVMDAQGRVLSYEIAKSSGRAALDQEALDLIQRAQPLPPLPADFPTRTLDAVVPIEFTLNRS